MLLGRTFSRPERMRMFLKQYVKEMVQLGVDSIGIVLLISFFIGAVICIQIKLNVQSPWMPLWVSGYVTREIMLLEFSSSIMCLILSGKVGSNIASELGTMRTTQQIDAYNRCVCNGLHRTYYYTVRPHGWSSTLVYAMVLLDGRNQVVVLCLYHFKRFVLLWL